jgi:TIR domain-containing protein
VPPHGVAFVAHSFADSDRVIVDRVKSLLQELGFEVSTGERPGTKGIGRKVRSRIEAADVFVAILTRRHRISADIYTTSPWVIQEMGYSLGHRLSRLILILVEEGIHVPKETGGLVGDLEYFLFDALDPDPALVKLRQALS